MIPPIWSHLTTPESSNAESSYGLMGPALPGTLVVVSGKTPQVAGFGAKKQLKDESLGNQNIYIYIFQTFLGSVDAFPV